MITQNDCLQIKAEEGRAISGVDLRPLIQNIPGNRDTSSFSSQDASGSTSQAASIMKLLSPVVAYFSWMKTAVQQISLLEMHACRL